MTQFTFDFATGSACYYFDAASVQLACDLLSNSHPGIQWDADIEVTYSDFDLTYCELRCTCFGSVFGYLTWTQTTRTPPAVYCS